jgi:hypothetical protein
MFFFSIFDFTKVAVFLAVKTHFIPKEKKISVGKTRFSQFFLQEFTKIAKKIAAKNRIKILVKI